VKSSGQSHLVSYDQMTLLLCFKLGNRSMIGMIFRHWHWVICLAKRSLSFSLNSRIFS